MCFCLHVRPPEWVSLRVSQVLLRSQERRRRQVQREQVEMLRRCDARRPHSSERPDLKACLPNRRRVFEQQQSNSEFGEKDAQAAMQKLADAAFRWDQVGRLGRHGVGVAKRAGELRYGHICISIHTRTIKQASYKTTHTYICTEFLIISSMAYRRTIRGLLVCSGSKHSWPRSTSSSSWRFRSECACRLQR